MSALGQEETLDYELRYSSAEGKSNGLNKAQGPLRTFDESFFADHISWRFVEWLCGQHPR